eukprot:IDg17249t1
MRVSPSLCAARCARTACSRAYRASITDRGVLRGIDMKWRFHTGRKKVTSTPHFNSRSSSHPFFSCSSYLRARPSARRHGAVVRSNEDVHAATGRCVRGRRAGRHVYRIHSPRAVAAIRNASAHARAAFSALAAGTGRFTCAGSPQARTSGAWRASTCTAGRYRCAATRPSRVSELASRYGGDVCISTRSRCTATGRLKLLRG